MHLHNIDLISWRTCTCWITAPAQCFKGFPCSMLLRFFRFFLDFKCKTALKNAWVCGPLYTPFYLPKSTKNDSKIHEKPIKNRSKNGCKIWVPLGICFAPFWMILGLPAGTIIGHFSQQMERQEFTLLRPTCFCNFRSVWYQFVSVLAPFWLQNPPQSH